MTRKKYGKYFMLNFLVLAFIFSGFGCKVGSDDEITGTDPDHAGDISSWAYQLQYADPDEIVNSDFDMVVIDYSKTGEEDGEYTSNEISGIKDKDIIPIAYISIGEAEDYRFYWDDKWKNDPPEWFGKENPEWEGNYKVKYWMDGWKNIVFSYLDRILAQGFSGVYLDIVDGFEYWSDDEIKKDVNLTEEDAALKMVGFIKEIAEYCRGKVGDDFMVIPQNGERIIDFDNNSEFINSISGIGIEDLFFNETEEVKESERDYRIEFIDKIKGYGKYVFSVDYVDDGSGYSGKNKDRIDTYKKYCNDKGYLPYPGISDRDLDELNIISTPDNGSRF